jgi:hypothetical protein
VIVVDAGKKAAWAKMTAVVLLEVNLHNPLAAAVGGQGQSEYALTRSLIGALPELPALGRPPLRGSRLDCRDLRRLPGPQLPLLDPHAA